MAVDTGEARWVDTCRSPDGVVHIAVGGDLDGATARAVRAAVDDAYAHAAVRVELDLRDVTFCSCAGLRMVFPAGAMERSADVLLVSVSKPVDRIIRLLRNDPAVAVRGPGHDDARPAASGW